MQYSQVPPSNLEPFTISGTFWLRQNPDHTVNGTLHFKPDGTSYLEVFGSLSPSNTDSTDNKPVTVPVFGVLLDGSTFVVNEMEMGLIPHTSSPSAIKVSMLIPRSPMLISRQLKHDDLLTKIHAAELKITNLDNFFDVVAARLRRPLITDNKLSLNIEPIKSQISIFKSKDSVISFDHQVLPSLSANSTFLEVTNYTHILSVSFNKITTEHYIELAQRLSIFFTVLTGQLQCIVQIKCALDLNEFKTRYWIPYFTNISPERISSLATDRMVIRFTDIKSQFIDVLDEFLQSYSDNYRIYNTYYGALVHQNTSDVVYTFSALIQVLERLYNSKYNDEPVIDQNEFKRILKPSIDELKNKITSEQYKLIKSNLENANRKSLRYKLTHLLSDSIAKQLLDNVASDLDSYIRHLVRERNKISHGNHGEFTIKAVHQVSDDCERLKVVVQAIFLSLIGIDKQLIAERLCQLRPLPPPFTPEPA